MDLHNRFQANWRSRFSNQRAVLLAVSGGVDSMVMAELFLRSKLPFAVAHCNFQLRGEDADKDEVLVNEWCAKNEVPFHNVRFDTDAKVKEWKKGIQETARILRYEWLEQIRKENNYSAIATAHHANDNAETLLMNLFKGTGISGLHGIQEVNGHIIRPLLFAERNDIKDYAQEQNVIYREDASNASDKYLRNAVRHKMIPLAEELFSGAVSNLNASIKRFAEAELLYRKAVNKELKKLVDKRGNDIYISILKLKRVEPLDTICYELFHPYGFTSAQVPHIIELMDSDSGSYIASDTHRVIYNRNFLIIAAIAEEETDIIPVTDIPTTVTTANGVFKFSIKTIPSVIPDDENIAFIDHDKVEQPMLLRRWKTGDYFYPLGMGMKKKKLSKLFKDDKVPIHEKERIWVLESNKRIVWVAGMRMDERFKLKPTTKTVLQVKFTPA